MAVDNKHTFYFIRVVWHVTINITNRLEKFGRLSDDYKRESQSWVMGERKNQIDEV